MNKYQWLETGTTKPIYTIMAKTEEQAINKLRNYLEKIGKAGADLEKIEVEVKR